MSNEKSRNLLNKKPGYIYGTYSIKKVNAESIDIEELLQLGEENKNINSL